MAIKALRVARSMRRVLVRAEGLEFTRHSLPHSIVESIG
jgi:hypothetical protein